MRYLLILLLVTGTVSLSAQPDSVPDVRVSEEKATFIKTDTVIKFFDGIYIGVDVGLQNIFGGSYVDSTDILAQDSRFVLEFQMGFRKQFLKDRLIVGAEFQFGITDGNLSHTDPVNQLEITYKNSTQWGYGLTVGFAAGKRRNFLIYGYLNETKRNFEVTIVDQYGPYNQKDQQGMLKYGIGLERPVFKMLNARTTIGGLHVDFGDLETNIDVEDKLDFTIGVICQF